jgi:hypothetical protein
MPKIIGIDLGTTNSVAAIVEADKIDIRKMKNLKEFLILFAKSVLIQKIRKYKLIIDYLLINLLMYSFLIFRFIDSMKNSLKSLIFRPLI